MNEVIDDEKDDDRFFPSISCRCLDGSLEVDGCLNVHQVSKNRINSLYFSSDQLKGLIVVL